METSHVGDVEVAAYPHPQTKAVVSATPGTLHAEMPVRGIRKATSLRVDVDWRTGETLITFGQKRIGSAQWFRERFAGLILDEETTKHVNIEGALAWLEVEVISALRDQDLQHALADDARERVALGERPRSGTADFDRLSAALGRHNEDKALAILRDAIGSEPWVEVIRSATADEDMNGVDIAIETSDIGAVYVQVKSSRAGATQWRAKYRDKPIFARTFVLVMNESHFSPAFLRRNLRSLYQRNGGRMINGYAPGQPLTSEELQCLPPTIRGLFEGGRLRQAVGETMLANMIEPLRLSVEKERLKSERVAMSEEIARLKAELRRALARLDEIASAAGRASQAIREAEPHIDPEVAPVSRCS